MSNYTVLSRCHFNLFPQSTHFLDFWEQRDFLPSVLRSCKPKFSTVLCFLTLIVFNLLSCAGNLIFGIKKWINGCLCWVLGACQQRTGPCSYQSTRSLVCWGDGSKFGKKDCVGFKALLCLVYKVLFFKARASMEQCFVVSYTWCLKSTFNQICQALTYFQISVYFY